MLRDLVQTVKAGWLILRNWREYRGLEYWQKRDLLGELLPWRHEIDRWEMRIRPKGDRGWMTYETLDERYGASSWAISGYNRMRPPRRDHVVEYLRKDPGAYPKGTYQCREILEGEKLGEAYWRYVHIGGFDPEEQRRSLYT